MRAGLAGLIVVVLVAVFVAYNALFTVHQTQQALVLQFGEITDVVDEPGLHVKVPFIQNAVYFDNRILDLDTPPQEVIAGGQQRLVVDTFARYRITDPVLFYQAVNSIENANIRLSSVLNSATRSVLGGSTFQQIVRDIRPELMGRIAQQVNEESQGFGITIIDVRIRRADLPEANSQAIYQRMETERQQQATQIRAEGGEAAARIRANADRESLVIRAEANRESEQIRGQGDAERNNIFAEAYGRDADFFVFYRSMQAYQTGLNAEDTQLVLTPDTSFFRFFNTPTGELPAAISPEGEGEAPPPSVSLNGEPALGPVVPDASAGAPEEPAATGSTEGQGAPAAPGGVPDLLPNQTDTGAPAAQ